MSFYGTPLKHGKGVNKPFRSPFLRNDQNQDQGNGTPTSRKLNTFSKLNSNTMIKSLGLKTRGFMSPLKPLELNSPSKPLETETISKSPGYMSPLKRLKYSSPSKEFELNSPLKRSESNTSLTVPENNSSLKSSESNSPAKLSHSNSFLKASETDPVLKSAHYSPLNVIESHSPPKSGESSGNVSSKEENLKLKLKSSPYHLTPKTEGEKSPAKPVFINTPPASPMILQVIESPEYQPVVKLQRLSPGLQNMADMNKEDMAILIKRISSKQREMIELRAKMPIARKYNLEEIAASIEKWREAFKEALETLRESLTEKNGCSFSTSDVLKLLKIPNIIVHFSEEKNDYIFPKL